MAETSQAFESLSRVSRVACPFLLLAIVALGSTGCGDPAGERLIGRWEGNAEGAPVGAPAAKESSGKSEQPALPMAAVSLLSQFEFTISLEFLADHRVEMSLAGGAEKLPPGSQAIEGRWSIVETDKNRIVLEIKTPHRPAEETGATTEGTAVNVSRTEEESASPERRRFVIRFDDESKDRFTLTEEGSKPYLGTLVFRRVGKGAE